MLSDPCSVFSKTGGKWLLQKLAAFWSGLFWELPSVSQLCLLTLTLHLLSVGGLQGSWLLNPSYRVSFILTVPSKDKWNSRARSKTCSLYFLFQSYHLLRAFCLQHSRQLCRSYLKFMRTVRCSPSAIINTKILISLNCG